MRGEGCFSFLSSLFSFLFVTLSAIYNQPSIVNEESA